MNELPKRKNMRLKDYDYSQTGAYFITICTKDRHYMLWEKCVGTTCGRQQLSAIGNIVDGEINKIQIVYHNVKIEKYVVMPNHVHMIIMLENGRLQVVPTISRIINQFKGSISKQIGYAIWQRGYHDHIIRNEQEYEKIWEYIDTNPLKWELDKYYMDNG